MIYIPDSLIDNIIKEDMPYSDITTHLLGIENKVGKISYYSRNEGVVSGVVVAEKIFNKLGAKVNFSLKDGSKVCVGDKILECYGSAEEVLKIVKARDNK